MPDVVGSAESGKPLRHAMSYHTPLLAAPIDTSKPGQGSLPPTNALANAGGNKTNAIIKAVRPVADNTDGLKQIILRMYRPDFNPFLPGTAATKAVKMEIEMTKSIAQASLATALEEKIENPNFQPKIFESLVSFSMQYAIESLLLEF